MATPHDLPSSPLALLTFGPHPSLPSSCPSLTFSSLLSSLRCAVLRPSPHGPSFTRYPLRHGMWSLPFRYTGALFSSPHCHTPLCPTTGDDLIPGSASAGRPERRGGRGVIRSTVHSTPDNRRRPPRLLLRYMRSAYRVGSWFLARTTSTELWFEPEKSYSIWQRAGPPHTCRQQSHVQARAQSHLFNLLDAAQRASDELNRTAGAGRATCAAATAGTVQVESSSSSCSDRSPPAA
eukprot:2627816-Prymnesium_polylepis.1